MDLNRTSIIGNVAQDPEQTTLSSGGSVTRIRVATNHAWKDRTSGELKERVNFHTVVAWNGLGQTMAKFLKKGDRVFIEGRLEYRTVERSDAKKGEYKQYFTDIIANNLIMLGGKKKPTTDNEAVVEEVSVEELPFE